MVKYYIVCPYFQSGGPEALHQLCNELNYLNKNAYIFYLNRQQQNTVLYNSSYPYLKEAHRIEDSKENVLIYPEIYTEVMLKKILHLENIRTAIWWLSINNAIIFDTFSANIYNNNVVHLFQSYYAQQTIMINFPKKYFNLHDYTRRLFTDYYLNTNIENTTRQNIIAYNPTKDILLPKYIATWNFQNIPLVNLSANQMLESLKQCKVYVDLGSHPGQDRIPREAAMAGCVIVTNRVGAAQNSVDIPIEEKIDHAEELKLLLEDIFYRYSFYFKKQEPYRMKILMEKYRFTEEVTELDTFFTS